MTANFLKNKNIWIIGGTSGIGLKIALQSAKSAKNVIVSGRSNLISEEKNIHFIRCDATKIDEIETSIHQIEKDFKTIDLIIFGAGIYEPMGLSNFNLQKSKEILEVNFSSFLNLVKNLPHLKSQLKLQQLAVISSMAGYFGMPNSMVYGASKAAISNLTESLFYELKNQIKVQLINPGFVQTRLTEKNNFKMPFLISDDKAAEIILKNLAKNNFEISFPAQFSIIMRLFRILPYQLRTKLLKKIK